MGLAYGFKELLEYKEVSTLFLDELSCIELHVVSSFIFVLKQLHSDFKLWKVCFLILVFGEDFYLNFVLLGVDIEFVVLLLKE